MFLAAQIICGIGTIFSILAMQLKDKKKILFFLLIVNVFFGINYLLLGSYTGAIICLISIVQTYINNRYVNKGEKLPRIFLILFIIVSVIMGAITYKRMIDILPIISSILYIFTITQEKEKNIRLLNFVNLGVWLVFETVISAYVAVISTAITELSTIVGIFRYDIFKYRGKSLLKLLDDFTINCLKYFLFSEVYDLGDCKFEYNSKIKDCWYNYIARNKCFLKRRV